MTHFHLFFCVFVNIHNQVIVLELVIFLLASLSLHFCAELQYGPRIKNSFYFTVFLVFLKQLYGDLAEEK